MPFYPSIVSALETPSVPSNPISLGFARAVGELQAIRANPVAFVGVGLGALRLAERAEEGAYVVHKLRGLF